MKRYKSLCLLTLLLASGLTACTEDKLDEQSIFADDIARQENDFDKWVKSNYTDPYNIRLIYRLEDMESDQTFTLAPADFTKAQQLSKIVKHAWLEVYDEAAGVTFTRTYVPKILHLIGSAAYQDNGTMVLGTAEGGLKVTLYLVNDLSFDEEFLNHYYFKTMHHEFLHILNQTKPYDTDFDRITPGDYVSGDWYLRSEKEALQLGFITPYASSQAREDYAEMYAMYVTLTKEAWDERIAVAAAAKNGADEIINRKLVMVKTYMKTEWNIDMDEVRNIVQRRLGEVTNGHLDLSPIVDINE